MDKSTQFSESSLTREEWQELDQTVFESIKKQLVGRRFIRYLWTAWRRVQSVTNDIYESDLNEERLVFMGRLGIICSVKKD